MMQARPLVLFDVDGTLVDSNYLHTLAWSRALRDSEQWAPMNAIHRLIGMGSDFLLPALIGRKDDGITRAWKTEYERLMPEVRPFPCAAELLRTLHESGVGVGLATSAPADHVAHLMTVLGIEASIDFAMNADDVEQAKPDPQLFLEAMHRGGGEAATTIVVGDSRWDVEAANAARLACVAVESGGFGAAELRDAGAVAVYRDVEHLRAELDRSPLAALIQ